DYYCYSGDDKSGFF
nr:immunoglobulin light chain junction region [Macaca mulatta]MOV95153.1 immunoglobulin light chain junction region [Macaca mulatta]MOV97286.1 immunoglobulin light chain junction region [Macaca mulatta]MOV97804.1 immunoglobulin light chain junction region [Macaca mulatta]MOV99190.1 immunoglobulin light chain junction region [Macaca mulatta]